MVSGAEYKFERRVVARERTRITNATECSSDLLVWRRQGYVFQPPATNILTCMHRLEYAAVRL